MAFFPLMFVIQWSPNGYSFTIHTFQAGKNIGGMDNEVVTNQVCPFPAFLEALLNMTLVCISLVSWNYMDAYSGKKNWRHIY